MGKRRSTGLLVLGIGILALISVTLVVIHKLNGNEAHPDTVAGFPVMSRQEMARRDEEGNVLPAADVLHIFGIMDKEAKSRTISDEDLDWLLAELKANKIPGERKDLARVRLLEALRPLENIPPAQEEKIFQAIAPMLGNDPTFADPLNKSQASNIMVVLNDKRAIPYLVPLLTHPDEQVRVHAKLALDALGYKAG